jgi:hypothetical protein
MRAFNRLFCLSKTFMILHQILSGEFQVPLVLSRQRRVLRVLWQPCPRKHRCAPASLTALDYRACIFTPPAGKTYSLFQCDPQLLNHLLFSHCQAGTSPAPFSAPTVWETSSRHTSERLASPFCCVSSFVLTQIRYGVTDQNSNTRYSAVPQVCSCFKRIASNPDARNNCAG